nr:uncharacterized protein LOC112015165 isoform X1 [Quercus suber]
MNRSSRKKNRSSWLNEKHDKSSRHSLCEYDEESAARTRPFSFDEIMLRRENKLLSENVKEGTFESGNILLKEETVENVSDAFESERGYKHNNDSSPVMEKHVSEKLVKAGSRKKEENSSMKEDALVKRKDRESCVSNTELKDKDNKDMSYKDKLGRNNHQKHVRRKNDEWSTDDSENEPEKKHSRDLADRDRHAERSREDLERGSKRKYRNGVDETNRDRNTAKKHDPRKQHDLDIPDRKERKESSKSLYEESRKRRRSRSREREDRNKRSISPSTREESRKRRWSRSREREDRNKRSISLSTREESRKRRRSRSREREDKNRRSISPSTRAHKHNSHHGGEHRELSSHSLRDRSGRQHSDIDRNRVSSNGSSSHYRRHSGYTSGLGGYSPRKRKTEAAIKTPSPYGRSPEKKSAGWDLPPVGTAAVVSGSDLSNFQSSKQDVASTGNEMVNAVSAASTTVKSLSTVSNSFLSKKNYSFDSVQLTQATRPMRRLYVENIPASASEKAVVECFNKFLLASGVNHIQEPQPCINCIMYKEKGQALVEFLTPEDALAALSFDGSSFSGSILKVRRPKDFVEVATGDLEKSVAAVDSISDIVEDSPNKIFIGGISKFISSKMLMEIVSVFGPLKAYHFEVNEELSECCAFLEYVDQSVTPKACAGLNGMKLGGRVLTVVPAIPDALFLENGGNSICYGIPEHAKPLLKQPTEVLKLKNVFNPESLLLLPEPEVEEVLEDIRLECTRFGTVKSVKVVKQSNSHMSTSGTFEVIDNGESDGAWQDLSHDDEKTETETSGKDDDHDTGKISEADFLGDIKELKEDEIILRRTCFNDDGPANDNGENKSCQMGLLDSNVVVEDYENISDGVPEELANQLNSQNQSDCHDEKVADIIEAKDISLENNLMVEDQSTLGEADNKLQEAYVGMDGIVATESAAAERGANEEQDCDLGHVFELGCVFVEYGRTEASCVAAHCLHGRLFDDRIVTVEFVALDLYRVRFPK